jgi:hypothetical protein
MERAAQGGPVPRGVKKWNALMIRQTGAAGWQKGAAPLAALCSTLPGVACQAPPDAEGGANRRFSAALYWVDSERDLNSK